MINRVALPGGETVSALGQGTWMMGERRDRRADEIAALRTGVEMGMTLIDTAEMYGEGAAETLIQEALGDRRDDIFIVSKAYPQNAGGDRLGKACEASLRRLGTDRIDLYLLHWRGSVPLAETVEAIEALRATGRIVTGESATWTLATWRSWSRRAAGPVSPIRSSPILVVADPSTTCCLG